MQRSDNFTMYVPIRMLLAAVLGAHALLGSSIHHHAADAEHPATCGHCHSETIQPAIPAEQPVPSEPCQRQCCVYVAVRSTDLGCLELAESLDPLLSVRAFESEVVDFAHFDFADDVLHPDGLTLRIWQCVWVI